MSAPFSKKAIADIGLFGDKMTQRTSTDRQLAIIDNQLDGRLREALKGLKILHDEEAKRNFNRLTNMRKHELEAETVERLALARA